MSLWPILTVPPNSLDGAGDLHSARLGYEDCQLPTGYLHDVNGRANGSRVAPVPPIVLSEPFGISNHIGYLTAQNVAVIMIGQTPATATPATAPTPTTHAQPRSTNNAS